MKLLGKSLITLIGLLLIVVLAFVFLVDANRFKPRIEALAKDQGIALQINGDLGWKFWPSLGVAVNEVRVAALDTPDQPIAQLQQASLLLALMPLFSGEFQVDHILLDGAVISLNVDDKGKGNWEALSKNASAAEPAQTSTAPAADANLKLDIEQISLSNSQVNYRDAQSGQAIVLRDINLKMSDANTRAEPFPFDATFVAALSTDKQSDADQLELQVAIQNTLSVDNAISNITLDEGTLQLDFMGDNKASLALDYSLMVTDLQNDLAYKGSLKLKETNARKLLSALGTELETANSNALSQFSLSSSVAGTSKQVTLDNMQLVLDDTQLSGSIAVTDFSTSALELVLDGNQINVDDYLPTPVEASEQTAATAAPAEDVPLPLEALRELNLDAKFALQRMIIKQMVLENILLTVKAKNGAINQNLTAKAYKGDVKFNSKTDARSDKAAVNFDGTVQGFELAPLLKDLQMDEKMSLSGAIQANTQGAARGATLNQLMASMNSTANFSGAQVRMAPLNIEEQFCKLVNLVTQNPEQVSWDPFTEMRQLDGNIIWRDQVISLNSFNAGVSQLLLASTGNINLASDQYEFKLPIKVTSASEAAKLKGCSLGTTNYWVDCSLSLLRCKGSFGAIDPLKDCGFDKNALGDLTKDFAEYKLREKHGAKFEEKKAELEEKVEQEKAKLFDKLQQSLTKRLGGAAAASSAAATEDTSSASP